MHIAWKADWKSFEKSTGILQDHTLSLGLLTNLERRDSKWLLLWQSFASSSSQAEALGR